MPLTKSPGRNDVPTHGLAVIETSVGFFYGQNRLWHNVSSHNMGGTLTIEMNGARLPIEIVHLSTDGFHVMVNLPGENGAKVRKELTVKELCASNGITALDITAFRGRTGMEVIRHEFPEHVRATTRNGLLELLASFWPRGRKPNGTPASGGISDNEHRNGGGVADLVDGMPEDPVGDEPMAVRT